MAPAAARNLPCLLIPDDELCQNLLLAGCKDTCSVAEDGPESDTLVGGLAGLALPAIIFEAL